MRCAPGPVGPGAFLYARCVRAAGEDQMRPCEAHVTQGRAGAGPGLRRVWCVRRLVACRVLGADDEWGVPCLVCALLRLRPCISVKRCVGLPFAADCDRAVHMGIGCSCAGLVLRTLVVA